MSFSVRNQYSKFDVRVLHLRMCAQLANDTLTLHFRSCPEQWKCYNDVYGQE